MLVYVVALSLTLAALLAVAVVIDNLPRKENHRD